MNEFKIGDIVIVDSYDLERLTNVSELDYNFSTGLYEQEVYFGMSHCDSRRCKLATKEDIQFFLDKRIEETVTEFLDEYNLNIQDPIREYIYTYQFKKNLSIPAKGQFTYSVK